MSEFTYMVFIVVASMAGALISLFVGVIASALLADWSSEREHSRTGADLHGEHRAAA
jgi:hypothetical protein